MAQPFRVRERPREVVEFLRRKWNRELDYRLKKELWGFRNNRMACVSSMNGTTIGQCTAPTATAWEFDELGYMKRRFASINDLPIAEAETHVPMAARPAGA